MSKTKQPTERQICIQFYKEFKQLQAYNYFRKKLFLFHIANEQYTNKGYTMALKAMGLVSGVADYCVLGEGSRVAFIEFKRNSKCKLSENQQAFKAECEYLGIPFVVHYTAEDAITFLYYFANEVCI